MAIQTPIYSGINQHAPLLPGDQFAGNTVQISAAPGNGLSVGGDGGLYSAATVFPVRTLFNRTANRALGVTYTNTTGDELVVYIVGDVPAGQSFIFYLFGAPVLDQGNVGLQTTGFAYTVAVPAGATYSASINFGGNLRSWYELTI